MKCILHRRRLIAQPVKRIAPVHRPHLARHRRLLSPTFSTWRPRALISPSKAVIAQLVDVIVPILAIIRPRHTRIPRPIERRSPVCARCRRPFVPVSQQAWPDLDARDRSRPFLGTVTTRDEGRAGPSIVKKRKLESRDSGTRWVWGSSPRDRLSKNCLAISTI
jgi:hypothetical protein